MSPHHSNYFRYISDGPLGYTSNYRAHAKLFQTDCQLSDTNVLTSQPEIRVDDTDQGRTEGTQVARITGLKVRFQQADEKVYAVNGVSFHVEKREKIAFVGESGCGKTVTGLSLLRLLPKNAQVTGSIEINGRDLLHLSKRELRDIRGQEVAAVFQDPMTSLNPVLTIGEQLSETLSAHTKIGRNAAKVRSAELLQLVGISGGASRLKSFPHQLSGGMRQRVMISMAIAMRPQILVADEPTTALDVTTQALVLEQLCELTDQFNTSLVLITHDLSVVARIVDRVLVMYAGFIVESAASVPLYRAPAHPYTVGLLNSVQRLGANAGSYRPIEGSLPDPRTEPRGCPFEPRCEWRLPICSEEMPSLVPSFEDPDHLVACHNPVLPSEIRVGRPARRHLQNTTSAPSTPGVPQ
jgi:oligopeptide/dipeptide ABC transporter ATP-binding protein